MSHLGSGYMLVLRRVNLLSLKMASGFGAFWLCEDVGQAFVTRPSRKVCFVEP